MKVVDYPRKKVETEMYEEAIKTGLRKRMQFDRNDAVYEDILVSTKFWRKVIDQTEKCMKAGGKRDVSSNTVE